MFYKKRKCFLFWFRIKEKEKLIPDLISNKGPLPHTTYEYEIILLELRIDTGEADKIFR